MTLEPVRSSTATSLERPYSADLSVRSDGRTVFGIAVPFGVDAEVNDGWGPYTERLQRGAFTKTLQEVGQRVKLCCNHDKLRRFPIGKATLLREDAAGLYGEFRVSKTTEGDEALTLIRDGVVDAFSVGFVPMKHRKPEPGVVERTEVALTEVSVVSFPAYKSAVIHGVRSLGLSDDELDRLVDLMRSTPDLLAALSERVAAPDTSSDEEAVAVDADEAADSEPADATRAPDTPDPGAVSYQPTQRPAPPSFEARKAQREDVLAMLAKLTRSA